MKFLLFPSPEIGLCHVYVENAQGDKGDYVQLFGIPKGFPGGQRLVQERVVELLDELRPRSVKAARAIIRAFSLGQVWSESPAVR